MTKTSIKTMELSWSLAELPSSQHRAGLAGLVMVVGWMHQTQSARGRCELVSVTPGAVTLGLDQTGLQWLFDVIYKADAEEVAYPRPHKKKGGGIKEPKRSEQREKTDKKGKTKLHDVYIYDVVVPHGALLVEADRSPDKAWIKLWRDLIWGILRGVPATRRAFNERAVDAAVADTAYTKDADKMWKQLTKAPHGSVALPSTYFIGAQAVTAEDVPFLDIAQNQFLLHFWPYAAQIFVPTRLEHDGKPKNAGYAIAVPDVANLAMFCEELPTMLRMRGGDKRGFRPAEAVVDVAAQGALEFASALRKRLDEASADAFVEVTALMLGVDVFHLEKRGNSVVLLDSMRVVPKATMIDAYRPLRALHDRRFRRQCLLNIIRDGPHAKWYGGFDELIKTTPQAQTIDGWFFRKDARLMFDNERAKMDGQEKQMEELVYQFVRRYVFGRMRSKYELEWKKVKGTKREKEFNDKKEKVAKEAFLAARSRTGPDFVEFFVASMASVSQRLSEKEFVDLSKGLQDDTAKVRTLTLLALCAVA